MLILGIAILLAFVLLCIWPNRPEIKLEFESLDGQFALLERVYPQWFGERIDVMADPAGQRVVCDYLSYKGMMISQVEGWEDRMEQFNADEMDYVVGSSIQADYWLSLAVFDYLEAFYHGDEAKQSEIASICKEIDPDLKEHLAGEVNSFKEIAQAEGFLDPAGRIAPDKRNLVILLHRYQWIGVAGNQLPNARIQPPEERLAVFRWQIEQSLMPLEKKLNRISRYQNMYPKDYDYEFAKAVLFANNGMFSEACEVLNHGLSNVSDEDTFRKDRYTQGIKQISAQDSSACKK